MEKPAKGIRGEVGSDLRLLKTLALFGKAGLPLFVCV